MAAMEAMDTGDSAATVSATASLSMLPQSSPRSLPQSSLSATATVASVTDMVDTATDTKQFISKGNQHFFAASYLCAWADQSAAGS
uniref:TROSPA n=1 Tax=Ixodes sinensis TaxID=339422 RepID=I4IY15_IXOSI|nr:TROSPA [Ixodes sinensis]CCI50999.1 tick receptor for ospA [Ixodes sinensis]